MASGVTGNKLDEPASKEIELNLLEGILGSIPTRKSNRYQNGGKVKVSKGNMNKHVANFNPFAQGRGMVKRLDGSSMLSSILRK